MGWSQEEKNLVSCSLWPARGMLRVCQCALCFQLGKTLCKLIADGRAENRCFTYLIQSQHFVIYLSHVIALRYVVQLRMTCWNQPYQHIIFWNRTLALMQWASTWCVYCSWKGFLHWKTLSEENFCQLILMGKASGGTWRNLCSKTLKGKKSRALGKGWHGEEVCGKIENGLCREVMNRANPVPLACLAKWKRSSSLPKNVMWQHTDFPYF